MYSKIDVYFGHVMVAAVQRGKGKTKQKIG